MPSAATVYRVFIASPGDVKDERTRARKTIFEWNDLHSERENLVALPIGWETHSFPTSGYHPQRIIDSQVLEGCDLLVAIFWSRLGEETPDAASGTVGEIEKHIQAGKPAMIYFSRADLPQNHDREQFDKVRKFEVAVKDRVLYGSYGSVIDFEDQLRTNLIRAIRQIAKDAAPNPQSLSTSPGQGLSKDAERVLLKATEAGTPGIIMYGNYHPQAVYFTVNNEQLVENDGAELRDILRWEAAMDELRQVNAVRVFDGSENSFQATPNSRGLALADRLRAERRLTQSPPNPDLSDDARKLLIAAAKDGGTAGFYLTTTQHGGSCMASGQEFFVDGLSPREGARWKAVADELVEHKLVDPPEGSAGHYVLNMKGYATVDRFVAIGKEEGGKRDAGR